MRFDPAATPSAHGAIRGAYCRGDLLIALLRMGVGGQNNPGTHRQCLRCAVSSDELLKALGIFSG
jgi:hypothetical protein